MSQQPWKNCADPEGGVATAAGTECHKRHIAEYIECQSTALIEHTAATTIVQPFLPKQAAVPCLGGTAASIATAPRTLRSRKSNVMQQGTVPDWLAPAPTHYSMPCEGDDAVALRLDCDWALGLE
jgi:hypothetical protein